MRYTICGIQYAVYNILDTICGIQYTGYNILDTTAWTAGRLDGQTAAAECKYYLCKYYEVQILLVQILRANITCKYYVCKYYGVRILRVQILWCAQRFSLRCQGLFSSKKTPAYSKTVLDKINKV